MKAWQKFRPKTGQSPTSPPPRVTITPQAATAATSEIIEFSDLSPAKPSSKAKLRNINNVDSDPTKEESTFPNLDLGTSLVRRIRGAFFDFFFGSSPPKSSVTVNQKPETSSSGLGNSRQHLDREKLYSRVPKPPNFDDPMFNMSLWYFKLLNINCNINISHLLISFVVNFVDLANSSSLQI